jgi:MFS family permease
MTSPRAPLTVKTLRLERYRAVLSGVYESTQNVFLLLILVRCFHGSALEKSLVASAAQSGLLFAPLVIFLVRKTGISVARSAGALFGLAALALSCATFVESSAAFAVLASVAVMMCVATTPLFTTIYAHNYSPTTRGRDFSQSNMIRIGCSVAFAAAAGWFLSGHIERHPMLLWLVAGCLAISACLAARLPGQTKIIDTQPLLSCFRYLRTDRVLRETTVAWTLLGFGVLMTVPLRLEYVANARYGLALSEAEIAFLLSIVPNVARLVSAPIWGRIFDRMDFFKLRIVLNWTFVLGTVGFFATESWVAMLISAAVFGIASSGGDLAWNLWVTKFAPLERVSDYMTVHVFFTGIRGILAPPTGFLLLQYCSLQQLSVMSAALMILSVIVLTRLSR